MNDKDSKLLWEAYLQEADSTVSDKSVELRSEIQGFIKTLRDNGFGDGDPSSNLAEFGQQFIKYGPPIWPGSSDERPSITVLIGTLIRKIPNPIRDTDPGGREMVDQIRWNQANPEKLNVSIVKIHVDVFNANDPERTGFGEDFDEGFEYDINTSDDLLDVLSEILQYVKIMDGGPYNK